MSDMERFVHKDLIERELQYSEVYHYMDKYINKEVYTIADLPEKKTVKQNHTIWVLWMQGMEKAPKLVQKCYDSLCRNKPDGYEVVLLTDDNLDEYIQLPEFIRKKYENGHIITAHLSDIIRLELLCTYGGCWIDATVFCSGKIPEYMLNRDIFMFRASIMYNVTCKMSNWWLAADKSNRIIHATRNVLHSYWGNETHVHNYYLFHLIMSKLIDEDLECRRIFNSIPYFNSGSAHVLHGKLGNEFDEKEWEIIKDISMIHKLSYKQRYIRGDLYTYYQAFLDGKLQ